MFRKFEKIYLKIKNIFKKKFKTTLQKYQKIFSKFAITLKKQFENLLRNF